MSSRLNIKTLHNRGAAVVLILWSAIQPSGRFAAMTVGTLSRVIAVVLATQPVARGYIGRMLTHVRGFARILTLVESLAELLRALELWLGQNVYTAQGHNIPRGRGNPNTCHPSPDFQEAPTISIACNRRVCVH